MPRQLLLHRQQGVLKAAIAGDVKLPGEDSAIFVTVGGDKSRIEGPMRMLSTKFRIYATDTTADFLRSKSVHRGCSAENIY